MPEPTPRHLALIPDGNRRWARARGLTTAQGHQAGIQAVGRVAEAAFAAGVEVVSFWWGSPANLIRRDPEEVAGIVSENCPENGRLQARFRLARMVWRSMRYLPFRRTVAQRMLGRAMSTCDLLMKEDGPWREVKGDYLAFEPAMGSRVLHPAD